MAEIKVPKRLTRAAQLVPTGEGSRALLSICSDEPYKRYDFWNDEEYFEVLDMGQVDDERLKAGLPILFNHDRDQHLARATGYANDGHKITLDPSSFVWASGDFAANKRADMESGALPDTSIGYEITGDGVCVGAKDELPIYKFPIKIYEASLVTIPADSTVGMGRQRDKAPTGEPVTISIRSVDSRSSVSPMKNHLSRRNLFLEQDNGGGSGGSAGGTSAPAIDAAKERADALKEFKARCKKIDDFVSGVKNPAWKAKAAEVATKHKDGDANFDDFRAEALNGFTTETQLEAGAPEGGGGGSGVVVGGERQAQVKFQTFGKRFTSEEGFKRSAEHEGKIPFRKTFENSFIGRRVEGAGYRAGFTSSDLSAINITTSQNLIAQGVQRLTIMDLISAGTMSTQGFVYPVETGFDPYADAALEVAEGAVKPEYAPNFTTDRADARVIAILMSIPKQFLADFSAFGSFIDARGEYLVDIRTERQFLYGDGLNENIKGIMNRQGVVTRPIGSDSTVDALYKAQTDIRTVSYFEPDGYAIHPYDWETIRLLKDLNGQYIAGGPFYAPYGNGMLVKFDTLWGLPVAVTKSVNVGAPICGAWKLGAQYFLRQGMTMEMSDSHKDYFGRNLLALLIEHRVALAVYRPNCFEQITGFPART